MRTRFHQGLDDLKHKLLVMGGLAEQAVDKAVEGYRLRDANLCHQVFDIEKQINRAEREIDELALDLLAMQQPMAVDLRFITACMKINADLERVGDQAVNIAERALDELQLPQVELAVDIPRLAATVAGMVRRALESFLGPKVELAEAVLKMDDIVDRMDDEVYLAMVNQMHRDPECTKQALDALLVSRNLERVADHATNIAEDVIFWVRGADVRHHGGQQDDVIEISHNLDPTTSDPKKSAQ
jgi:phosphate transport system protein